MGDSLEVGGQEVHRDEPETWVNFGTTLAIVVSIAMLVFGAVGGLMLSVGRNVRQTALSAAGMDSGADGEQTIPVG